MTHPTRLYLASVCALQVTEDSLDPGKRSTRAEHTPSLLMAPTMDDAANSLKLIALDTWKKKDGWSSHSATIQPFKKEFIPSTFEMVNQGVITLVDDPTERQKLFNFDDDLPSADIQELSSSN
jgi:hypothetical protein